MADEVGKARRDTFFTHKLANPDELIPKLANLDALKGTNLEHYISQLPRFPDILERLQSELHLFEGQTAVDYGVGDFLAECFKSKVPNLKKTAVQLLSEPLSYPIVDEASTLRFGPHYFSKVECYVDLLIDVQKNKLAQEPHEKGYEENVNQHMHALQAGKISAGLDMDIEDVLGLLFHKIARSSVDNSEHGHSHHCQEGSEILAPLGLATDYSRYQAFAKQLLYLFCPEYKSLISPTSEKTLKSQTADLGRELSELNKLEPAKLAFTIYKLMFMRLIDDMSKVPTLVFDKQPEYFGDLQVREMLIKQIIRHIEHVANSLVVVNENLEGAIRLLLRARGYTTDPFIYEEYSHIIDGLTPRTAMGVTA